MQSSSNQTSCLSLSRFNCSSRNSSVSSFIPCRTLYRESKLFLCHRLNAGFQWRKTVLEAQWRIRDNSFLRRKLNRIERICTRFVCYSAKKSGTTGQKSLALEILVQVFFRKANYLVEKLLSIRNGIVILSFSVVPSRWKFHPPLFPSLALYDNPKASLCCFVIVSALDPNPIRTTRLNIERV